MNQFVEFVNRQENQPLDRHKPLEPCNNCQNDEYDTSYQKDGQVIFCDDCLKEYLKSKINFAMAIEFLGKDWLKLFAEDRPEILGDYITLGSIATQVEIQHEVSEFAISDLSGFIKWYIEENNIKEIER